MFDAVDLRRRAEVARGAGRVQDAPRPSLVDVRDAIERRLMTRLGMPDSLSLKLAFDQFALEWGDVVRRRDGGLPLSELHAEERERLLKEAGKR